MKKIRLAAALALAALIAGCGTAPKAIPEELSASELVQKAQDSADHYDNKGAIAYYQAALDRFGSDPEVLAMGEYEIAFMYYKEGRYADSKALFDKLLARYSGDGAQSYPPRYRILAEKVLPQVEAKLKK
jgi:outer membrane protein assembly factor BamD (BamD/ComL family)